MISLESISSFVLDGTKQIEHCDRLGFINSIADNFLTFLTSIEYAELANNNPQIKAALWDVGLGAPQREFGFQIILVSDAKLAFALLHNSKSWEETLSPSIISPSASIHPTSWISPFGVFIGENAIIEANSTIFPNTWIGSRSIVRSGAQIGSSALHVTNTPSGDLLTANHYGRTTIMNDVEIGNNSVIDRAMFDYEETFIGDFTKIGCLVNISHGVRIGPKNRIAAGVQVCGYTQIGEDNWIGPGVIVSHMLRIGSGCYLSLGSSILHDIEDSWKVVGNKIFKDRKLF